MTVSCARKVPVNAIGRLFTNFHSPANQSGSLVLRSH